MVHGASMLLLTMAAGYLVLERSAAQKKSLKSVGQVVGWVIILTSLVGLTCKAMSCGGGRMGHMCPTSKAGMCPFTGKPLAPATDASAQ